MKRGDKGSALLRRRNRVGYFFIFPLILGVLLVFIPNLIQTFQFSLSKIEIGNGYTLHYEGIGHYIDAWTKDPSFVRFLLQSLGKLATTVPVLVIFSLFIATLLNQKFHGRTLARAVFFVPVILATGIISAVEIYDSNLDFLSTVGADRVVQTGAETDAMQGLQIDKLLTSMNFSPALISIVTGAVSGIYTIVKQSGMQIFIWRAGLQEIPTSLYEAAKVEGCNKWELFWKITFPMISPQIAVCVVYTIVDSYSSSDGQLFSYIQKLAFGQQQYELATAMYISYLLCLSVFIGLVFFILSRFIRRSD